MTAAIITSLLLMTAVIAIRGIFGRRLRGRALSFMWAVVFVKLAVPVSIPSAVSVMNLFPADTAIVEEKETVTSPETLPVTVPRENNSETPAVTAAPAEKQNIYYDEQPRTTVRPVREKQENKSSGNILLAVYAVIAAVLELGVLAAYAVCSVRFSKCEAADIPEEFAEKNIRFVKCSLDTPAVFGIFRPVILIPEGMERANGLEHIILHEKTHIRHRDQLWSLLTLMICCAHWTNAMHQG